MKQVIVFFSFLNVSISSLASDTAIQILDELRDDLNSFSADFNQYELYGNGATGESSSGQMWLQAPNKFRWDYIAPMPQLIVANGSQVWIYDEDLEQVTIKPQNSEKNPLYVLLDKQLTEENYIIELQQQDKNIEGDVVRLTPKLESEEIKSVWVTVDKQLITQIRIQNTMENTVVFEFEKVVKNPVIESGFFDFTPPKGVDIIEDSLFGTENQSEFLP